jgi:exodeoxyribonuclease V beta subunit
VTRRFEPLDVFTCPLAGVRQIEASAGTGKTWNICGLYLRLLLERGLEVQRILVVTFTNAATAELRERIRQRIADTLAFLQPGRGLAPPAGDDFVERLLARLRTLPDLDDATLARRLELALATFDEAAIFTIHGFCQRALADTPFTAQMPLALELVRDDARWVAEAANDFWRRRVAADDLDAGLAAHLVARKDSPERFAALLKRHLAKPMAQAAWPEAPAAGLRVDDESLAATHAAARALWLARRDEIVDLVQRSLPALSAVSYKEESVAAAVAGWDELLRQADGMAALEAVGAKAELLGRARLAKATKKNQATPVHEFFDVAQALLDQRERATQALAHRRLALIRQLLEEGAAAQRAAKRRRRAIAFDDMLFNLHERLTGGAAPWLAGALKARFPAALIDEFQDTDPLQFAIFKTIYASDGAGDEDAAPLFFVGDPKQAIYSFRNADLHTYLEAGEHAVAHYSLAENQRSTEPLIRALNQLFGANPRAFMMEGLAYQDVAFGRKPRKPFLDRSGPGAALQVWELPKDAEGEPLMQREAMDRVVQASAGEIARLLAAAQRGEITLGGAPLAAGDIAVLVRSNAQGALMRRALAAVGVGSVELSQASVFRSTDAEDLDRVLSAVLEPAREKKLKAALATEAMGADAARIEALASDEAALLAVVQRFAAYRETWLARGVGFMLRQWMAAEQVTARLLARADGERRLTNLLHLVECLHEAAQTLAAPDTLLRWFQAQRREPAADDATQLRLESDRNLVQIVTIHKSKGLEYPVVFCPFLWLPARTLRGEAMDGVPYHDAAGRAVIDYGHEFLDDAAKKEIRQRVLLEESAETLRLVYVALTRAVHRCVIAAGCFRAKTGNNLQTTTSRRTLLNWLAAGGGMTPEEWFEHKNDVGSIHAAWAALAERSGGDIALLPLPDAPPVPLAPERAAPESLAALAPPHPLPQGWRIGSFSALAHGARHDGSGIDHDLRLLPAPMPEIAAAPVPLAADDILNFPRGAAAGECIHRAFEEVDFSARASWPGAIASALQMLRTLGLAPAGGDAAAPHARMLERMLEDVLETPLPLDTPTPLRLATLPPARRLTELEFHLPAHRFDAHALNELLQQAGYAMPRLAFGPLRGFLKGFIDLVFEHEGRFFILDWKSNHLGDTPAHYARAPLAAAMRAQGYHLQYLLYAVALDRYLRTRIADYRYETHFGGAVYLFVRGVRPGWTDASGHPAGVFFHRPAPETIRRLSALFDPHEAAA